MYVTGSVLQKNHKSRRMVVERSNRRRIVVVTTVLLYISWVYKTVTSHLGDRHVGDTIWSTGLHK